MKKLYICQANYSQTYIDLLKTKYKVDYRVNKTLPDEEEMCEICSKYDAVTINIWCPMTRKVLDSIGTKEFFIATSSVGLDHFHPGFFKTENIKIFSCHGTNALSVAEHTIGVILALYKKIIPSNEIMLKHQPRTSIDWMPSELTGKTIGLIGSGQIARKVIKFAQVFDLKIFCYSIVEDEDLKSVVEFCDLETLLKNSDIVSLHAPLTKETFHMLNENNLKLLKSSALVINTARLQMIDNKALAKAVNEGKIGGAALDIDDFEHAIIDMFKGHKNVILTPHTAGVTHEAWDRMLEEITNQLMDN